MQRFTISISLLLLLLAGAVALGQEGSDEANGMDKPQSVEELQKLATEIMQHDVGTWDCRWEFLDDDGNVANKMEGSETFQWVIPDRVLQATIDVPDLDNTSVSLKFFKPDEKLLYFISVDKHGDMWTFTQPVTEKTMTSKRHANPEEEGDLYLRFTPQRIEDNEMDVLMESSSDKERWKKIFMQYMVRRTDTLKSSNSPAAD